MVRTFLVICAGTGQAQSTKGILFQKYVYSTFSMKMVLNCIHIWSVNFFLVKDNVQGRNWISMQHFEFGSVPIYSCLDY